MQSKMLFQLKIAVILVFFVGYIWLEISLNSSLVMLYSESLNDIFGQYVTIAHDVELFGRIITSFGLALTLITFLPDAWFGHKDIASQEVILSNKGRWLYRPSAFVLLWIMLIPTLRLVVDTAVYQSNNADKLSAIRSVVFKEAYNRGMIEFASSKSLTDIVQDEEQRKLVVALIPSLAYFSPTVKNMIQDRTEELAISFMESEQEASFISDANPLIQQNISFHDKEWRLYKAAKQDALSQKSKVSNFAKLKQLTDIQQKKASQALFNLWNKFTADIKGAESYVEPIVKHFYKKGFETDVEKYWSSRCDSECKNKLKVTWTPKIKGLYREIDGKKVFWDLNIKPDMNWLNSPFAKKRHFRSKLRAVREDFIANFYGVPIDIEYEAFINHKNITEVVVNVLAEDNIIVPKNWDLNDAITLKSAIKQKYDVLANQAWINYEKNSELDIKNHELGKISFSKNNKLHQHYKVNLGRFYYPSYQVYHSGDEVYTGWKKTIDNLNFIRMLTDSAAEVAFSPGGMFYQLGIEAVKFSVIPPISIVLSFIAIFALMVKFFVYLNKNNANVHATILLGFTLVFVAFPIVKKMSEPASFFHMMDEFAQNTQGMATTEHIFNQGFGVALDIESVIYKYQQGTGAAPSLGKILAVTDKISRNEESYYAFFRRYDNWFNNTFEFLPKLIGVGDSKPPYDFNLTVYKRDLKQGFYAGLQYNQGKVTKVSIPNIFDNSDAGFLLEQKLLYKPDYASLLPEYLRNIGDADYWLSVSDANFAKQSMLEGIENKVLKLFQSESGSNYAQLIAKSIKNNKRNVLLIQHKTGSKFDCYTLPKLSISNLLNGFSGNAFPEASPFECKGEI